MDNETDRLRKLAISAYNAGMPHIIIPTDADLTPPGKRRWKIVRTTRGGRKCAPRLRWYVGPRVYRDLPLLPGNAKMSLAWANGPSE